jgi:hypothetical protein
MDLKDFADVSATKKPATRCTTCKLPAELLAQVDAARSGESKISYRTIAAWLEKEGHPINGATLANHERFGHIKSNGASA